MSQTDASPPGSADPSKQITGYCEPWTLRAGESVRLMASSHRPGPAEIDITRIACGDPTRYGPGFDERPVPAAGSWSVTLDEQPLTPGSYGVAAIDGMPGARRVGLRLWLMPTLPDRPARIATLCAHIAGASPDSAAIEALRVDLCEGRAVASTSALGGDTQVVVDELPLTRNRWYLLDAELDLDTGTLSAAVTTAVSDSPGRDAVEASRLSDLAASRLEAELAPTAHDDVSRHGAGGTASVDGTGGCGRPRSGRAVARSGACRRAFRRTAGAADAPRRRCRGVMGPLRRHGRTDGARRGSCLRADRPASAAHAGDNGACVGRKRHTGGPTIHHTSTLSTSIATICTTQAGRPRSPRRCPVICRGGIYAFRVRSDAGEDRVPFFVRPAVGARTADVALLMPTATYMAYANHRMLFEGADFIPTKTRLRPEHAYIRDRPELGRSHYEKHPDGSGVMFSSRLRPVLNLRPGADGWNFTPDTDINAFLEHLEVGHDIVTDEDLHADGLTAIAPYRVLVTGSHPEYWSTVMLDALADWQRDGGRLMYLGGNGFYWKVAFSDDWPGAIELRRAEDGVRNWQTGPGESYHAWGGEYGGMWRRQGRAPNEICGIGFAAQGFEKATYFVRDPGADSSRAAWGPRRGARRAHRHLRARRRRSRSGGRSLRRAARLAHPCRGAGLGDHVRARHAAHQGGIRRLGGLSDAGPHGARRHGVL